jgi:hypothetical protein
MRVGQDSLPIGVAETEILAVEESAVDEAVEDEGGERACSDNFMNSRVERIMLHPARVTQVAVEGKPQVHLIPNAHHNRHASNPQRNNRKHAHHVRLQRHLKKVHHNKINYPRYKSTQAYNRRQHCDKFSLPVHKFAVEQDDEQGEGCE